jgi:ATP-dependent RNA helicase RhlE
MNNNSNSAGASRGPSGRSFNSPKPGGFTPRPRFGGGYRGQSNGGSRPGGPRREGSFGGSRGGSFGGSRGGYRGGGGGRRSPGGGFSRHIDVSKFVNKAVITEKVENFVPEHAFTDFNIDVRLKGNIVSKGYVTPTPIQDKVIPHILRGADVVGIANTGTGKTAAFLIPLINKVLLNPKGKVLIVGPTRELAQQIEAELKAFAPRLNVHGVCAVGGAHMGSQIRALSFHFNFLIGTPGRLKDLIERGKIRLADYSTVVLDEADRMLDMGFIGDIKYMIAQMPAERQTLFFSATMSREIETLIKTFCKMPVTISVKTQDTSASVDQDVVRVMGKNKIDVLHDLLIQPEFDKVLVFGKTKHGVQRLAEDLNKRGFKAEAIHGNKSQGQRVKALKLFKDHHVKILVATDVAARGLDITGISHVINFDIPATYDDYVHRIGRTGRGGKKGKALTFV